MLRLTTLTLMVSLPAEMFTWERSLHWGVHSLSAVSQPLSQMWLPSADSAQRLNSEEHSGTRRSSPLVMYFVFTVNGEKKLNPGQSYRMTGEYNNYLLYSAFPSNAALCVCVPHCARTKNILVIILFCWFALCSIVGMASYDIFSL